MPKTREKPPFSIISSETIDTSPPRKLGPHGTALWNTIQNEYRIQDSGGRELLCQACQGLDRAETLAEAIARDGNVVYSRAGVPRTHPSVKDELNCRAFVCRQLERLGVTVENVKSVGRPPTPLGWAPRVG